MWQIRLTLAVEPPGDCDKFRGLVRASYLELVDRGDIYAPEVSAELKGGCVEFSLAIDLEEREASIRIATAAVRAALSGAGFSTPGWEKLVDAWIAQSEIASRPSAMATA